jgi:hypothetical protein
MAMSDGVMPNGRNSLGGRKPAIPAKSAGDYKGNPPAGAPSNADITSGYASPGPSTDTRKQPSIPSTMGTHMGSTADTSGKCPVSRRNIKADAR